MRKTIFATFMCIAMLFSLASGNSAYAAPKGKVIVIVANRMGMQQLLEIQVLKSELEKRGYAGLMNIRGSKGTSDVRSYASIGWGSRAYLDAEDVDIRTKDLLEQDVFKRRTAMEPMDINNIGINTIKAKALEGEYSVFPGMLGEELKNNGLGISVVGNADTDMEKVRYSALMAMDKDGNVPSGEIEDINKPDSRMPFGIATDYEKLKKYTQEYYEKSEVTIVELGDTYRLDAYRPYLNDKAYGIMQKNIYKSANDYIGYVLGSLASENDRVYVLAPHTRLADYKNYQRLAPIMIFDGEESGIAYSDTTRREGVIGNIDVAADILDYFGIRSELASGKPIEAKPKAAALSYLEKEYAKIASTYQVRIPALYTYAVFEMLLWISVFICIMKKDRVKSKYFNILSKSLQFTGVVPFVMLIEPAFGIVSKAWTVAFILAVSAVIYFVMRRTLKTDLDRLIFLSVLNGAGILCDAVLGQEMIKRSILGYDSIIGARYYGIGNEYMGILIGAALLGVSGLLQKGKIKKSAAAAILVVTMAILGFPKIGANVGGLITAATCFLLFVLKAYDVKIDFKRIILIGCFVVGVVVAMALLDIYVLGSKSHLAGAIQSIGEGGPQVIVQIIQRKIEMNYRLIGASIWSKVFIIALLIVGILFYRPFGILKTICSENPWLAKGWISIIVGSFVGFVVNDSGVVAAATSISFVIISALVLSMNKIVSEKTS
ncbi:hypothetical protein [Peptoclostridium acidaminophilum]|nr:hypothetical protein [Peptoclostridium acidaminophilum]